jgi:two-component system nitrate/nitrite response regulator NarL
MSSPSPPPAPTHPSTPRIAILSERNLFREGLIELLGRHGHPDVARAASADELLALLEKNPLALVLLDLDNQRDDPRQTLRRIHIASPSTSVVMIGTTLQNAALARAADGWLENPDADSRVLDRMAGAADGQRRGRLRFPQSARLAHERRNWERLTPRQQQVIEFLAQGADNRKIAERLGISERAVKVHVGALLKRFRAHNRTEVAVLATRAGLGARRGDA